MTLELAGRIVALDSADPERVFVGRVGFSAGSVAYTKPRRNPPTPGSTHIDVGDAFIYPGLIDLHSHLGYNALPLWRLETRAVPWLHRDQWPGAATYKEKVSWPAYAYLKGSPQALMAYVQVRALAGGTTAIQGWPPANGSPANKLLRNIDEDLDTEAVRTSVINLDVSQLRDRARLMQEGKASFIYHLSEGQLTSRAAGEFDDAAQAGCLHNRLIAIHCTAVDDEGFKQWKQLASLNGGAGPGGIVWSPFSNLWLYGETSRVEAALRRGVKVAIGSDWGPSGSKNLLGELKVAKVWAEHAGLPITDHELVNMVTASPGDLIARAWGAPLGRLTPGAFGDAVVVAKRRSNTWSNLISATEADIQLVIQNGKPVYGTQTLMKAAGAGPTTAVPIGGQSRRVPLRQPGDASKLWTWRAVLAALNTVVADPHKAIKDADDALATALGLGDSAALIPSRGGLLILEPDMPGGAYAIAGPPPPGAEFTMVKPPSLVHDRAWFRSLPTDGFDAGLLAKTATYYGY
jgi:cytosine/adenosine deaminase-related metal-dependent hydrolase